MIRILLLVLLLLKPITAEAASAYSSSALSTESAPTPSSPKTLVHDVGTGAGRAIVVFIGTEIGTSHPTISGVTVGSDALEAVSGAVGTNAGGATRTLAWCGVLTEEGSQTISVSWSAGTNFFMQFSVMVLTGAATCNNGAGASGGVLAVTSSADGMTATGVVATAGALSSDKTERNSGDAGSIVISHDTDETSGTNTHTWVSITTGAIAGVHIPAAATTIVPLLMHRKRLQGD